MVSYNVSLFTSNKHPRRTSACAKGSLREPFHLFPPSPFKVLSLVVSSHPFLLLPTVNSSRAFCADAIDPLLKIIYIFIFFLFVFTQATRYFLIILLIDASSSPPSTAPFFRSGRAKISHENDHRYRLFCFSSPQSFGKSPPLVVLPPVGSRRATPVLSPRFTSSSRREEKIPARYPPENYEHTSASPLFPPFF